MELLKEILMVIAVVTTLGAVFGCSGGPDPYANLACQRDCRAKHMVNDPSKTTKDRCVCKERE